MNTVLAWNGMPTLSPPLFGGVGITVIPSQGGIAIVETYALTTSSYMQVVREVSPPLMARDYKAPNVVSEIEHPPTSYRVRGLTPTECGRLQGFADRWCADLGTEEPIPEDIAFWKEVFETWRKTANPDGKPKTDVQIIVEARTKHGATVLCTQYDTTAGMNALMRPQPGQSYCRRHHGPDCSNAYTISIGGSISMRERHGLHLLDDGGNTKQ